MSQRPTTLDAVWREEELCEKLGLPVGTSGRSRQLSNWIKGGLKHMERSDRRYFAEQDVIDFLWGNRKGSATGD